MSNLSLKATFREDKFNLKTIGILFILVDLSILPIFIALDVMIQFLYVLLYQASLIFGLMIGLRGQGKYKVMMLSLQSIARNRELSIDEREKRLVNGIHHHCLELGYIYEERNEEYGLFKSTKNKVPKKTKNFKEEKNMSETETKILIWDLICWKQFGYMIVGIWGLFGFVLWLFLDTLAFHWALIIFLAGAWEFIDVFILFYIHYAFKIEPEVVTLDTPYTP